jgi:hypothetical protein
MEANLAKWKTGGNNMPKVKLNNMVFDARPDRVDLRDREYRPALRSLPPQYPDRANITRYLQRYKKDRMILDQGQEGACTGFGLAAVVNYLLWREARLIMKKKSAPRKVSERMLYHLAKFYDEWPGEDYEGSSCRGAMKGWHRHGVCAADYWPYRDAQGKVVFIKPRDKWDADAAQRPLGGYYRIDKDSIVDMQSAIVEVGAIYVSAQVHDGWFGKLKMIRALGLPMIQRQRDPSKTGGHAFAIVGYNEVGFIVQNSWGSRWGKEGFAILPYDEWVNHGMDAWVAVMGAPVVGTSPHYQIPVSLKESASAPREFIGLIPTGEKRSPLENRNVPPWSDEEAYRHSIVTGNNGIVLNRDVTSNTALDYLQKVVYEKPLAWAEDPQKGYQLVLYAHGGVNDEQASIKRIRILAPYFQANEAYPIFFTWKTGFVESLGNIIGDEIRGIEPQGTWRDIWESVKEAAKEAKDRAIEGACQELLVKAVWSQMKQNASAAAHEPRATLELTVGYIEQLCAQRTKLRIHLVGHSAGSILLGYFLDLLLQKKIPVATCTLFAPACTVPFALEHYRPATDPTTGILKQANTVLEILGDERELADTVGPYGKSLLYLVSRALEDYHKMPLLGMANVWAPQNGDNPFSSEELRKKVKEWQQFWSGGLQPNELTKPSVSDGQEMIPSAHGSFDNDVDVITRTIERIIGAPLTVPIESLHGL